MAALNSFERARRGLGVSGGGRQPLTGNKLRSERGRTYALLTLPSIVLIILINLYPLIFAGVQSVNNGSLVSSGDFVGLANYGKVLGWADFWHACLFTLIFTVVGVLGSWVIGLALALGLRAHIPASGVFKVLLLLPWVVPIIVSSMSWNWLVATPQSPIPMIASALGFHNITILSNPTFAGILVCLFKVWASFPFMMMMMMSAALTSIDKNVYEAARVDGAAGWNQFMYITLPLIARTTYISWILMTIFCVNDFPTIYLLTGGGPVNSTTTLVVLAYRTVFENFQVGPGVAIAFLTTIVLVVVSIIFYRRLQKVVIE